VVVWYEEDGYPVHMPLTVQIPPDLHGVDEEIAIENAVSEVWGCFDTIDYFPARRTADDDTPVLSS